MFQENFIKNFVERIYRLTDDKKSVLLRKLSPLSESQERIVSTEKNITDLNNVTLIPLLVNKRISTEKIGQSLDRIIERHEVLRTCLLEMNGEIRQIVLPELKTVLSIEKLVVSDGQEQAGRIRELLSQIETERFDLFNNPLWRCRVFDLNPEQNLVVFVFHQTIFDGLSLYIFLNEMLSARETARLPNLNLHYSDYVGWQKRFLSPERLERVGAEWVEKLSEPHLDAVLPPDKPKPEKSLCRAGEIEASFSIDETARINKFCSENKLTLPMLGAAALAVSLMFKTNVGQTTLGIPVAGRTLPETERLIGSFVNIAPLRVKPGDNPTVGDLLRSVKEEMLFLQENQEFPFRRLLELLYPNRELSNYGAVNEQPLLRIFLDYKGRTPIRDAADDAADFALFDAVEKKTGSDIYLKLWENENIFCGFLYNAEIFEESTIRDFIELFKRTLLGLSRRPQAGLWELNPLSDKKASFENETAGG
ncbi:hypothetical protein H6S82_00420 [Planktothrix sp. FACHB-1355]|uniref:condensation domain-containing protein n=1 Tax=Planktothrix sp. FACHB-1355 TaxID=2692854 RepID=UPI00168AC331|nr:condensation domain-containing protein [Planktothrix sp. FACHB-1355]MBD3557333.1 hypothetical protein [Planktothrix sp. FACHB-1355]